MSCPTVKRLCNHLVLSQAVTFAANTLTINLPAASYNNLEKYCIVVAQALPDATTITAPVVITIGASATTYPLVNCDGTPVLASSINTRTRYSVRVNTGVGTGVFRIIGKLPCTRCTQNAPSLPIVEA